MNNMEIEFDRVEISNVSTTVIDSVTSRVRKYNRTTYALSLEGNLKIPIGDGVTCKVQVSSLQGNEFRIIASKQIDKICEFLKKDKIAYSDIEKYSNIPPQGVCPIPPVIFLLIKYLKFLIKFKKNYKFQNKYVITDYIYTPNSGIAILKTAKKWKGEITCRNANGIFGILTLYFGVK